MRERDERIIKLHRKLQKSTNCVNLFFYIHIHISALAPSLSLTCHTRNWNKHMAHFRLHICFSLTFGKSYSLKISICFFFYQHWMRENCARVVMIWFESRDWEMYNLKNSLIFARHTHKTESVETNFQKGTKK